MNTLKNFALLLVITLLFGACSGPSGNYPGTDYMPDMGYSVANEANVYNNYWANSWDEESVISRKATSMPRLPVKGTIPRGYAGYALSVNPDGTLALLNGESSPNAIHTPINGDVPYYYADTEEDRNRAMKEITKNPFPITSAAIERGKNLYVIYCGICHGDKGDGSGYLVRDNDGKYPAQPANLINDEFTAASEGRFYHAIMHGKNAMGSYADKLSYEERWDVIHFIRSLQAGAKGAKYDESENTLNSATPASKVVKKMAEVKVEAVAKPEDTNKKH